MKYPDLLPLQISN